MKTGHEAGTHDYSEVVAFWFGTNIEDVAGLRKASKRWFEKNAAFDNEIRSRFNAWPDAAVDGELDHWLTEDQGLLALILVLDQFPRNLYRNQAKSFSYDHWALQHALDALKRGLDRRLHPMQAVFLFLPLEHSENLDMQHRCLDGLRALERQSVGIWQEKISGFLRFAIAHLEVIEQFGRFPHRNKILGRESTAAEIEFLAAGKGAF